MRKKPKCLIVCPEKLFENAWLDEKRKYKVFRRLNIIKLHGPDKYKSIQTILNDRHMVVLTTPDTLALLWKSHPRLFYFFKQLVVDESTKYKNPTGVRFKTIQKMLLKNPQIKQRICLTGTPHPNGYLQQFSQLWIVGKTEVFNGDKFNGNYRDIYFRQRPGVKYPDFKLVPELRDVIDKRIAPWVLQPNEKEYREMPPIFEHCYRFDMLKSHYRLDQKMKKTKVIKWGGQTIKAANAGVVLFKRMQIASGVVYKYEDPLDPGSGRVPVFIHNYKTDILEDIIDEHSGSNILVLYNYHHERDRILKRFQHCRLLDNDRTIRTWNKGRIRLLAGHPASMGHGLNLQLGGSIIIWYSVPPDYEHWWQTIKRLHRGAITEPVYVLYLVANNTVDDYLLDMVGRKQQEDLEYQQRIRVI